MLDEAIEEMSASKRQLALLLYKEGRTLRDAAAILGISYATVRRWNEAVTGWLRSRFRALFGTPVPMSTDRS